MILDELENDFRFTARHPCLVDRLALAVAKLRALKSPIPGAAQILDRAAKLQANVAIAKASRVPMGTVR